jgi:subtilisin family serine protease
LALVCGLAGAQPSEPARPETVQILVMLHMAPPHFRPDSSYSGEYLNGPARHARIKVAQAIADKHHLTLVSSWPMPAVGIDCYLMDLPGNADVRDTIKKLSEDARVEWAQEINLFAARGNPDSLYPIQPSAKFWHLDKLHKVTTGKDVRIAVIDSGVEDNHPDLLGQVVVKENFVEKSSYVAESHGTEVAGVIAALDGNGIGRIKGVAPQARIMALRACWQDAGRTVCNSFTIGKALNFAILNGAKVVNMSFSGPHDRLLQRLIETAQERGIVIVAASTDNDARGDFPASAPGVFAVADKIVPSRPAGFIYAPGQGIPTTTPHFSWALVAGNSFSAAHVSGFIALIIQLRPQYKQAQIRSALMTREGYIAGAGSGNIDVCSTLQNLTGNCIDGCP